MKEYTLKQILFGSSTAMLQCEIFEGNIKIRLPDNHRVVDENDNLIINEDDVGDCAILPLGFEGKVYSEDDYIIFEITKNHHI